MGDLTMSRRYQDESELRRLYDEEGMSQEEMADELECSQSTVQRWMDRHDIESRDLSTAIEKGYPEGREHHNWVERATLTTTGKGYYEWREEVDGERKSVRVSRLLAVAEYGFDAVKGKDVHHKLGSKGMRSLFDYHENIELVTPEEHGRITQEAMKVGYSGI